MQKYAEEAVREHLSQDLQPLFDKEKVKKHRPPFSNDMTPAEIEEVLDRSIRQSERYRVLSKQGMSFDEIRKTFDQPLEQLLERSSGKVNFFKSIIFNSCNLLTKLHKNLEFNIEKC